MKPLSGLTIIAAAALALTGCSTAESTPAATQTVTVTATPTSSEVAARTVDSPIDAFDAYWVCSSAVFEFATGTSPAYEDGELDFAPYSEDIISESDDGFRVQLRGDLGDGDENASAVFCVVSGTVGDPTLVDALYPR
jgi:hypothetical protein